jgi:hypothetical protein
MLAMGWDKTTNTPVLYREEFYPYFLASEYQQALSQYAIQLSDYMWMLYVQ